MKFLFSDTSCYANKVEETSFKNRIRFLTQIPRSISPLEPISTPQKNYKSKLIFNVKLKRAHADPRDIKGRTSLSHTPSPSFAHFSFSL